MPLAFIAQISRAVLWRKVEGMVKKLVSPIPKPKIPLRLERLLLWDYIDTLRRNSIVQRPKLQCRQAVCPVRTCSQPLLILPN